MLLGHADGLGISPLDDRLDALLTARGLKSWMPIFQSDLSRAFSRRGKWESPDELMLVADHLERVLWQLGFYPWFVPETGGVRAWIISADLDLPDPAEDGPPADNDDPAAAENSGPTPESD